MTEVWKDFVDEKIQDRYMISNLGKVFDKKNEKVLNQTITALAIRTYLCV